MASIKPEELIEEVRQHPVLYDQTEELYRNSDYKDMVWKQVAMKLNVIGQEKECKKRWNGIRDSLRRARQKRKTTSGQVATSTNKYKYERILHFLIPHLVQRKGLSNVQDEEDDADASETDNESEQQNPIQNTQQIDISNVDEPEDTTEPRTPDSRDSAKKRPSCAGRKRKLVNTAVESQESASSHLMAYILAEKEAEVKNRSNSRSQNTENHVDAFLAGIAPSLKSLDPIRLLAAKGKIFNVVQEFELQQLRADTQQETTITYVHPTSSAQTSSASTPSHITLSEEDADVDGHPHYPYQLASIPKSPSIATDKDANL